MLNLLIKPVLTAGIINPVTKLGEGGKLVGSVIFGNTISAIICMFLVVGFILAILHFIFGAVRWITAGGDKTHLQSAQERMSQAVVGMIMLAAAWAIVILVSLFLGWDKTTKDNIPLPIPTLEDITP